MKNILVNIIKSDKESDLIKGPMFSIKKTKVKEIVRYLIESDRWNVSHLSDSSMPLSPNILFDELKIFPLEFKSELHDYSFSPFSITNFYAENKIPVSGYVLECFSKTTSIHLYSTCLGKESSRYLSNHYHSLEVDGTEQIFDIPSVFLRPSVKDFYEFDFFRFDYFIKKIVLEDFIIDHRDLWWQMDNLNFLPLEYINN